VAFLHSASPPILHRDLRSANILLNSAGHVKVATKSRMLIAANCLDDNISEVETSEHWLIVYGIYRTSLTSIMRIVYPRESMVSRSG